MLLRSIVYKIDRILYLLVTIAVVYSIFSIGYKVYNVLSLVILPLIALLKKDDLLRLLLLYLLLITCFIVEPVVLLFTIVFTILYPIAFSKTITKYYTGSVVDRVLGSTLYVSSRYMAVYTLLMSILVFFKIDILIPLVLTMVSTTLYTLYYNALLRKTSIELRLSSSRVVVDNNIYLYIDLGSRENAKLIVYVDNRRYVLSTSKGRNRYTLTLTLGDIGEQVVRVKTFIIDKYSLTSVKLLEKTFKVNVVPTIEYLIVKTREVLGEGLEYPLEVRALLDLGRKGRGYTPSKSITGLLRQKIIELLSKRYGLFYAGVEGEKYPVYKWLVIESLMKPTTIRTRIGDYRGVRYYVPGDDLRSIHWKKTISRRELVVKEVEAVSKSIGLPHGSSRIQLIILDPCSANHRELDRILSSLLLQLANSLDNLVCLVIVLDNEFVLFRGKGVDVLRALMELVEDIPSYMRYEYNSLSRDIPVQVIEKYLVSDIRPLNIVSVSNTLWSKRLLEFLWRNNIPGGARLVVIHGSPVSTRWSYAKYILGKAGYILPRMDYRDYMVLDKEYIDRVLKSIRDYVARD